METGKCFCYCEVFKFLWHFSVRGLPTRSHAGLSTLDWQMLWLNRSHFNTRRRRPSNAEQSTETKTLRAHNNSSWPLSHLHASWKKISGGLLVMLHSFLLSDRINVFLLLCKMVLLIFFFFPLNPQKMLQLCWLRCHLLPATHLPVEFQKKTQNKTTQQKKKKPCCWAPDWHLFAWLQPSWALNLRSGRKG